MWNQYVEDPKRGIRVESHSLRHNKINGLREIIKFPGRFVASWLISVLARRFRPQALR
jgi:hypothetical protein